jgi:hypothetical protein
LAAGVFKVVFPKMETLNMKHWYPPTGLHGVGQGESDYDPHLMFKDPLSLRGPKALRIKLILGANYGVVPQTMTAFFPF